MRRFFSWLIVVPALVAVTVFAINNKSPVVLDLWPFGLMVEMPVYLAFLLALAVGALVGGTAAWLGQGRVRGALREQAYEGEVARRELNTEREKTANLERELDRLRAAGPPTDAALTAPSEAKQETLPPPAA